MSAATISAKRAERKNFGVCARMRKSKSSYVLISPFVIMFTIFTVIPVLAAIFLSFTYFNLLQPPSFVGLMNYQRMFLDDEVFLIVLKNTLLFAIITGPLGYLIAFMSAWMINELGPKLRAFMTFIFYAPTMANVLYTMWGLVFSGDQYGYANAILMNLGLIQEPIQWLSDTQYILPTLIVVQLWMSLGIGFLSFIAGFQNLDRSYFEAAAIDGIKNRWQELWYVTIPQLAPQMLFSAVMQIGASFGVSVVISTLAGSPTTQYCADTLVTYINDVGVTRFEMGYASAIAVFLFVLMLLTNYIIRNMLHKYIED